MSVIASRNWAHFQVVLLCFAKVVSDEVAMTFGSETPRNLLDSSLAGCDTLNCNRSPACVKPLDIRWRIRQKEPAENASNNCQQAEEQENVSPWSEPAA